MDDCVGCPQCGNERTSVAETRIYKTALVKSLRRRRICSQCGHRYWTMEIPDAVAKDVYSDD
jgi:transcriptional regulator NrdR family protein